MEVNWSAKLGGVDIPGFELVELIHESGPRIIIRAVRKSDRQPVILKTLSAPYPRTQDVAEIRREFQILQRLQNDGLQSDGVIRVHSLVTNPSGSLAIEMELFGISFADVMAQRNREPLALDFFFSIALRLVRILGLLHERDVVHKDIGPQNLLFDRGSGGLRLIDFGISSELSRERQSVTSSARLEGSLPYMSPEQTGRISRDLDYRSDYYSLGVTFFELLTGKLPFTADNPLEWVHRHISMAAPAARDVNREIPAPLSRIVSKLMSKNAEDRYQSAHGLIADLERCRDELERSGSVAPFELGQADASRTFQIPQQLYGREKDIERLVELFDDVTHGATSFCLISGYAGVGKSALVNELGRSIVRGGGYLIQGKFDQFRQSSAYGAFALAFRGLMEQLLGEPKHLLDGWRKVLQEALGRNGQLVIDLVPELELIVGEQPPVAELPPAEAQNRFQIVFLNFIKAFADARHPLVIFMDDLQWSDFPTLNLIQRLVTAREMGHLLVLGAYRSSAVDASHPLRVVLNQIQKTREVIEFVLEPLDRAAVDRLTADTLYSDPERTKPLSAAIYEKASGNPFFLRELLKNLNEDEAIFFDPEAGRWDWDMAAVRGAVASDSVVDFMVAGLRRLEISTQHVLQLAACVGHSFDLRTLSTIYERSMEQTAADLHPALKRSLVVPLSESYKFVGRGADASDGVNPTYKFQHDRVQQAAYALIDHEKRQAVHLSMGRLIQQRCTKEEIDERLIEIVGHLNAGRELIHDAQERRELARLNLEAGTKARRSSAYASALDFLRVGHEMLADDAWESDYDLTLSLSRELQQCAYLTGNHDEADSWTTTMLDHARTSLTKAEILSARTRQYATIGRMRESVHAAFAALSLVGVELIENPGPDAITHEIADVQANLGGRDIPDLLDAPELTDPEARIAIHVLMEVFPATFLSGSGSLFPYLVLKSVNLSLRHGNSSESAFAYAAYGMLLCGALSDPALGYKYGKLAVAMNERFNDIALKSRIIYVYTMFIHHWSNHWSSMTPWFLKGIEAGYQSGDLLYLAYSAQDCIIWDPKLDLESASREQRKYLAIVQDCNYQDSLDSGTLFLQMQLNFQGLTDGLCSMNDASFDEGRCVEGMQRRRFMTGIANYHIYKAEIHCFYGEYEAALDHVRAQDEMVASSMSLPQLVRFYMVAFLTCAALCPHMKGAELEETLHRLRADLRQMALWADNCPENCAHLRLMMEAELARLEGRMPEALALYEQAICTARSNEYRRDEALANELAGRYMLTLGLAKAAEGYLRAAHYVYYRWGAHRKVEQMDREYPQLLQATSPSREGVKARHTSSAATRSVDSSSLDMTSVMRASQAISGEIVLDQLLKTTLHILLENAGGQRGVFVASEHEQLVIRARVEAGPHEDPELPLSVINNVLRTGTVLVLNDASDSSRFATDPYFVKHRPKSVICVPIRRQGRFNGAIYMENSLTAGVFTEQRVEVLKLLSAQASIAMENALLYEDQARLIKAQERFVPAQFLESLGRRDIAEVRPGEYVAREMSVMFADLRDFTPLAERMDPRAVIELLNRYFSRLGEPITSAGGFIDSFNGDEIMALFALPADQAVAAGVEMWRALEAFNRESVLSGGPPLEMGLGVNTGPLVLGTVGGNDRLKCGVVGDTVNTASRLEQLTKLYRAPFLISEHTYGRLRKPDMFSFRMVDRVAVKGKRQAIAIYEVLDAETPERRCAKESTRERLRQGMEPYFAGAFGDSERIFKEALAIDPEDAVLSLLAARSERYATGSQPVDWQGFETLDHK
jgi:predicted ATPase/class 3 adenylate cyclase